MKNATILAAALAATHTVAALSLATPNMAFEIANDASASRFAFPKNTAANKDFWRVILDDGDRTEIPVFSHAQKGRAARRRGNGKTNDERLLEGQYCLRVEMLAHGLSSPQRDMPIC